MRSFRPLAALACTLALAAPALAQVPGGADAFEAELTELSQHARARTVLIFGVIGMGSGAVVDHKGTVVTNAHVVAGARYAIVQWADGRSILAKRRGIDYGRDLAILEPVERLEAPVPAFGLAEASPAKGDWVLGAGFPGGLRTTSEPTLSLGRIMDSRAGGAAAPGPGGFLNYSAALRSDLPIFSGNSGGPMIDRQGRLAGINGAVDLEKAVSLTIPIEVVREQLGTLKGGIIVLPTGQTLQTESGLLRGFYRATDRLARQLPERVAQASRQAAQVRGKAAKVAKPVLGEQKPSDGLADRARALPRQRALAAVCEGRELGTLVADGIHLTQIAATYAVCKASLLGERRSLTLGEGVANVIATSDADDLALLRLPTPRQLARQDAPHRPVGSLVYARGKDGLLAAGMLSVPARPTSAAVLAGIQGSGAGPLGPLLGILERLAKTVRMQAIQELIDQIKKASKSRGRFAAGTPPRSYREVLSIDAPVPPSRMGAPVFDRHGQLIGAAVGVAHHGTAYVAPIARIRAVFLEHLGGATRPQRRGKARLF